MSKVASFKKGDLIIDPYKGAGILVNRCNIWQNFTEKQDCWVWEVEWSVPDTSYISGLYNINEENLTRLVNNGIIKHYKNGESNVS